MESICGVDCTKCEMNTACRGCTLSNGCPFGKKCFIAAYIQTGGMEQYEQYKKQLIDEFNRLDIPGMPKISELYALNGAIVNLPYPLPSGDCVKLLDDHAIYLGNQVECAFDDGTCKRCYGLVTGQDFLLVSEYGENGDRPEIIVYQKRI